MRCGSCLSGSRRTRFAAREGGLRAPRSSPPSTARLGWKTRCVRGVNDCQRHVALDTLLRRNGLRVQSRHHHSAKIRSAATRRYAFFDLRSGTKLEQKKENLQLLASTASNTDRGGGGHVHLDERSSTDRLEARFRDKAITPLPSVLIR